MSSPIVSSLWVRGKRRAAPALIITVICATLGTTAVLAAPANPNRPARPTPAATTGSGQQSCTNTLYQRTCTRPTPVATRARYDRRQQPQPSRPIYPTRRPTPQRGG